MSHTETAFVPYGGLTTVMMNYYRAMDKKGLKLDFASTNHPGNELINELNANNSEYYRLGDRKKRLILYLYRLIKLLKKTITMLSMLMVIAQQWHLLHFSMTRFILYPVYSL